MAFFNKLIKVFCNSLITQLQHAMTIGKNERCMYRYILLYIHIHVLCKRMYMDRVINVMVTRGFSIYPLLLHNRNNFRSHNK